MVLKTIYNPINLLIQLFRSLIASPKTVLYMCRYKALYVFLQSAADYKTQDYYHAREGVVYMVEYFENVLNNWVHGDKNTHYEKLEIKRLLCTLYCDMLKLHMMNGDIELACLAVIRAFNSLDIDRLPTMPVFDLKTARVVKAGLAASRMLEEEGCVTLMVRQNEESIVTGRSHNDSSLHRKTTNVLPFRKK